MTVDGADSTTLTATVTNDRNSAGVTWTVSGGGSLSNTTTTSATYTAPAATSSSQTATITATSVAKTSQSGTVTITIPAKPAVTSTSTSLTGTVGTAYSVTLQASGGISPYTWALGSGTTLPSCLKLSSSGVITTASGTAPTASCAGAYSNLTFTVTDSGKQTALSATSAPLTITIAPAPAITFVGSMPATGTYGAAYAGSAAATGGAGTLTYSISGGALPPDLALNPTAGAIAGTLSKAADVGNFSFTVQAADAYGDSNSQTYTLVVSYPTVAVNAIAPPTGYVGSVYTSTTLTATGGNGGPYNWTWVAAGGSSLPPGLALSTGGAISGTPTSVGTYMVVATATDLASNSGSATLTIQVKAGVSITTATALPTGYVGSNYSQQLAATGGTGTGFTWSVQSGSSLPGGMNLSSGGLLSGTPTTTGTPSFTLTVTDSVGNTASATFSVTISPGVSVTSPTLQAAYPGAAFASPAFSASGGTGTSYTWTMTAASGSSVPANFSIGSSTGVISSANPVNTGAANATYSVVVTATDSAGNHGSATVTITIEPVVTITPATLPSASVSVTYTQPLSASGGSGTGYTWAATGTNTLSNVGLSFTAATATVSGTPTLAEANQTGSFTAQVTDSQGHSAQVTYSITAYNAVTITTASINSLNIGQAASQTLTAAGGSGVTADYSWSWTGSVPAGLSLSSAGAITGTPTTAGSYTVTVKVTDSGSGTSGTQNFTITIYGALSLPTPNPSSLPSGYTNVAYTGSVTGTGGSGNLSMAVTTALSPANGTLATNASGATVSVTGTPNTATTESFGVTLTDTTTSSTLSKTYTIAITTPTSPSLPTPSTTVPGSATQNQGYSSSIAATGGVGPTYTWTVNGTAVPTSGSLALGTSGLGGQFSVSNSGGSSTLSISGNPTSTGTVSFTSFVTDNTTHLTSSTQNYSIQVNSAGQTVSGQILLNNNCAGLTPNLSIFSVTITNVGGTAFTHTVPTDSGGNYTFASVPNGTYTITPTLTASGPSAVFYPATQQSVAVNNSNVTGQNFYVSLGYTVTGTASYSGTTTSGQLYLLLVNNNGNCGGSGGNGTSMPYPFTSGGNFTIRGVPPGNYSLLAYIDPTAPTNLGEGAPNSADPSETSTSVSVSTANVTGVSVTLNDPGTLSVGTGLKLKAVAPENSGAVISFGNNGNGNGIENYTSYTVQWSTTTAGFSSSNQATFKAVGTDSQVWILRSGNNNFAGTLSNGTAYYFRAMGTNSSGNSPWGYWDGSGTLCTSTTCAATATIGAPSGSNTVSGAVTIPTGVTVNAGAVLYAGLYDESTNTAYADIITSPASGANNFTVNVPSGSNYILFGILDQNNDGLVDKGDDTNVNQGNGTTLDVTGNLTGQNFTLPATNSVPEVQTQYQSFTSSGGTSTSYALNFIIGEGNKLPVAVTLTGGPSVINPVDISNYCQGCGRGALFQYYFTINNGTPSVGDAYTFNVTYSDGTSETVTGKVTGWDGGTSVVGASGAGLATNLAPSGTSSTSLTPNFTWTYPANPSDFTYQFQLQQGNGSTIWQIPGSNSNFKGFTYAQTSGGSGTTGTITWGIDPTGDTSNNLPSGTQLTTGTTYDWMISAQDSNGNQAQVGTYYVP